MAHSEHPCGTGTDAVSSGAWPPSGGRARVSEKMRSIDRSSPLAPPKQTRSLDTGPAVRMLVLGAGGDDAEIRRWRAGRTRFPLPPCT